MQITVMDIMVADVPAAAAVAPMMYHSPAAPAAAEVDPGAGDTPREPCVKPPALPLPKASTKTWGLRKATTSSTIPCIETPAIPVAYTTTNRWYDTGITQSRLCGFQQDHRTGQSNTKTR